MSRKLLLLLLSVSACLGAYQFFLSKKVNSEEQKRWAKALPMGIGAGEDKEGRREYEIKKFADPATGQIPSDIRRLELEFSKKLPVQSNKTADSNYFLHGPYNGGGRTRAVAIDATNEDIILAGGVTGGMFRSIDGGQSYEKTTAPGQLHSVTCIAQDLRPGRTNIWYYGTGEHYGVISSASFSNRSSGDGLYSSINGGKNWTPLASTVSNTPESWATELFDIVWKIVLDHTNLDENVVLAAVKKGIVRSSDGGSNWEPVLGFGIASNDYTDLVISESGIMYASIENGTDKGFWRSTDGGMEWTDITPDDLPESIDRTVIAIAPSNEDIVYFLSDTPGTGETEHSFWKYTYQYGNGSGAGGSWENRSNNLPLCDCSGFYIFEFCTFNSQTSYNMFVKVHPDDPDIVFLGGTNIYRSVNGWTSDDYAWIGGYYCDVDSLSNYVYPNHHPDQHDLLFFDSDPSKVLSASDGGLAISEDIMADEVTWRQSSKGYVTTQFYTIAIENGESDSDNLVAGAQDNGTWWTNTKTENEDWEWILYGDGSFAAIENGGGHYYLSWQTGKVFKCVVQDDGTMTHMRRIDPPGASGHGFINPLILDPADENKMYFPAGRYIWRNDDLSEIEDGWDEYTGTDQNWVKISESDIGISFTNSITSLSKHKDNDHLFYGTANGQLYRLENASAEDPIRVNLTADIFPSGSYLNCIAIDELDAQNITVVFSNYSIRSLFNSSDGGETWVDISGNLEEESDGSGSGPSTIWAAVRNTTEGEKIYLVATSVGLYQTETLAGNDTEWIQVGTESIGNVPVNMIVTRAYDDRVTVATHGNGIYEFGAPDEPITVETIESSIGMKCYPNPFRETSTIELTTKEATQVSVHIFSGNGGLVWEAENHRLLPGTNNIRWNGNSHDGQQVSPGLYHVRILGEGIQLEESLVKL